MMIDRNDKLSFSQQAKLLSISRGSVYYTTRPTSEADLALMRCIDELHLEQPSWASACLYASFAVKARMWAEFTYAP